MDDADLPVLPPELPDDHLDNVSGKNDNDINIDERMLIFGYIHNLNLTVPSPIINLITDYYPFCYKIYGIGPNNDGLFGNTGYGFGSSLFKSFRYGKYKHLSFVCDNLNEIYFYKQDIIIKNVFNEIYIQHSKSKWQFDKHTMSDIQHVNIKINNNHYIQTISEGITSKHILLIDTDRNIYGVGDNDKAQLGIGNMLNRKCIGSINNHYNFKKFNSNNIKLLNVYKTYDIFKNIDIKKISCGLKHTLFLTKTGKVISCGYNKHRQCGIKLKDTSDIANKCQLTPTFVLTLSNVNITDIKTGLRHNLCLSSKNELYVFGDNDMGQLGLGSNIHNVDHGLLNQFFSDKTVTQISCGKNHSICLLNDNECYLFGNNAFGQIGTDQWDDHQQCVKIPKLFQSINGYQNSKIIDMDCGGDHSIVINKIAITNKDKNNNKKLKYNYKNQILTFGYNNYGQVSSKHRHTCITNPYELTKSEIGCGINEEIVKVICGWETTLVVCK